MSLLALHVSALQNQIISRAESLSYCSNAMPIFEISNCHNQISKAHSRTTCQNPNITATQFFPNSSHSNPETHFQFRYLGYPQVN